MRTIEGMGIKTAIYDIHETFLGQKFGAGTLLYLLQLSRFFQFLQILPDIRF